MRATLLLVVLFVLTAGCGVNQTASAKSEYLWNQVTAEAAFPTGYNFPVFVMNDRMIAFREVGWKSKDGLNWTKSGLPKSGLNSAFQKYVQLNDAVYALGTMEGNIERMKLTSRIARTRDGENWEVLAEKSNLPQRVFYGMTVFKDKIWMFGGMYDGTDYDDVWNSADGVNWQKVGDKMPWKPRQNLKALVFKEKLFLIGDTDVWSSPDGLNWTLETERLANNPVFVSGYSAAVFDGKIWLVGINRNGAFQSGVLFSADGKSWREMKAPWSPRGAVAVWVFGNKLFMTGGKSSFVENGETKFVYSNDVWALRRN